MEALFSITNVLALDTDADEAFCIHIHFQKYLSANTRHIHSRTHARTQAPHVYVWCLGERTYECGVCLHSNIFWNDVPTSPQQVLLHSSTFSSLLLSPAGSFGQHCLASFWEYQLTAIRQPALLNKLPNVLCTFCLLLSQLWQCQMWHRWLPKRSACETMFMAFTVWIVETFH